MLIAPSRPAPGTAVWRTGLYGLKPAFVTRLRRFEDLAYRRGVSPDAVSALAIVVAAVTAVVLVAGLRMPLLWLGVGPLCLTRMACNAVDGSLARRSRKATPRGAILNELGDRVADAMTFAALAPPVGVPLALGVVLVALSTSFVAVVGQAVLGQRFGVGPLGKPDRVAVLSAAATVAAFAGPQALVVGSWTLIVLGVVTIGRRILVVWQRAGDAA